MTVRMEFFQKIKIWPSINESTNAVVEEELRVFCQHKGCEKYFKYKQATANMNHHLKDKHNLANDKQPCYL